MRQPTETEWKVIEYAKAHPELNQKQVAEAVKCHATVVCRAFMTFLPERIKKYIPGVPTELQARILDERKAHPEWLQVQIAKHIGCDKSIVSQTIRKYMPELCVHRKYISHKKKEPTAYTMRECRKCDKPFKSLWIGNRICPDCLATMEYQCIPDHMIYVKGHGRV